MQGDPNQNMISFNQPLQQPMGEAVPTQGQILPGIHQVQQLDTTGNYQIHENSNILANILPVQSVMQPDQQLNQPEVQQIQINDQVQDAQQNQLSTAQIVCSNTNIIDQIQPQPDLQPNNNISDEIGDEENLPHYITANVYQIAMLNKMLPKGFKFDVLDVVKRQTEVHMKKTAGLVNYMNKKPEIQNELKQKKLIQKYNQRRLKEQQKLEEQQAKIMSEQRKMYAENGTTPIFNKQPSIQNNQNKKQKIDDQPQVTKKEAPLKNQKDNSGPNPNNIIQNDPPVKQRKVGNKQVDDGPSAKEYFNADFNNGINQSEYSETKVNTKFNGKGTYEQYSRFVESIVMHKVLLEQQEVPLFLRNPDPENFKNYKSIMNDFGTSGFLNFNIILQRLKNKKYGPGKQNVKHDLLCADIRKIFQVCEKYFNFDPISIRVSRTLESYFENEIKKIERGEPTKADLAANTQTNLKGTNEKVDKNDKNTKSKGVRQTFKSEAQSEGDRYENSSFSYKRIKKDKKKDKKKKQKKNKDRRHDRDSDDGKDQTSIGNVNAVDLNEEIEKGEAYGSNSGNLARKQRLYNNITEFLTISQKKGIIPIVQEQLSKEDPVSYQAMIKSNQKFEFDLFSLPDNTCQRLEQYVNDCIQQNQRGSQNNQSAQQEKEPENQPMQPQIDPQPQSEPPMEMQNFEQPIPSQQEIAYVQQDQQQNPEVINNDNIQNQGYQPQQNYYNLSDLNQPYLGDKHSLIEKIGKLDSNQLKGIVPIVQQYQMNSQQQNPDDTKLEFDLYDLPDQKLKELHNYVEDCICQENAKMNQDEQDQQNNMDQMKQYMENQQMVDSNGMLQGQLDINNQMQQQIYNNQQQNYYMNQQQFTNGNLQNSDENQQQMMIQQQHQNENQQNEVQQQEIQLNQVNNTNTQAMDPYLQDQIAQKQDNDQIDQQPEHPDNLSEMDLRIKLVQDIKKLSMNELTQLGMVMGTKEYKELTGGENGKGDQQGGDQIELNVNELSLTQIQYLQKFVDNLIANKNEEATNVDQQQQQQQQQPQSSNEMITTDEYNQQKQVTDQMIEENEQKFQQIAQWCQQQIDEQMEQYNRNQQVLQEYATMQTNAPNNELSQENQTKFYNAMQIEQTIQMNLQQIQKYHFDEQNGYQMRKNEYDAQIQEIERKHQLYLQSQTGNQEGQNLNENNINQNDINTQNNKQIDQVQNFSAAKNLGNENHDRSEKVNGEVQQSNAESHAQNFTEQPQKDASKKAETNNQVNEQSMNQQQPDMNNLSLQGLQERQKQLAEEYNNITMQMTQNQQTVEQIVQVTQQLQQMYQQHQQLVQESEQKGQQVDQNQAEQMAQVPEQINMHNQQIMTIMQHQQELQNKITELKNENDQINMAVQMMLGQGEEAQNQSQDQKNNEQDGNQTGMDQIPAGMTQEQMNNYYMQMQYQQQMNFQQQQNAQEIDQQQQPNGDMILENKGQEPEQQTKNQQFTTPYNTQMDFEKANE